LSSAIYIIFGLLITFLVYFLIAWGLSSFYFFISKERVSFLRNVRITATLAGAGFLANILSMIALSNQSFYLLAGNITVLGLISYYLLLRYFWEFNNFDAIVLSTTLAILMNLAWLRLLGML
jgi:hypothetical protein